MKSETRPTWFESAAANPKAFFGVAAGLSFVMSIYLFFSGDHERGIFVGLWVPSILSAGNLMLTRREP